MARKEGTVSKGSTQKAAVDDMVAIDIGVQVDDALMAPSSALPRHREANGVDSAQGGGGCGGGCGGGFGVGGGECMVDELPVAAGCVGNGVPPRNHDGIGYLQQAPLPKQVFISLANALRQTVGDLSEEPVITVVVKR